MLFLVITSVITGYILGQVQSHKDIESDAIKAGTDKAPAIVVILGDGSHKVRLAIIEMDMLEQLVEGV